ncbi:MAG: PspC domain-containing protein [Acidobacteriaceae bacterium]|nr:PspC domain-containing protein [Acidobacteriaceae bacterium]
MFCTKCGSSLRETDRFCSQCAAPASRTAPPAGEQVTRLTRSRQDKKISGVCGGIARYLNVDATLLRIVAIVLLFWPVPFVAAAAYVILAGVMPQEAIPIAPPHGAHAPVYR